MSNLVSAAFNPNLQEVQRTTGVIKWWDDPKGYGFIIEDGTHRDVFVHWRQMWWDKSEPRPHFKLEEGQRLEFELREEDRGAQAFEVVVLK